jgi:hypothetical protein
MDAVGELSILLSLVSYFQSLRSCCSHFTYRFSFFKDDFLSFSIFCHVFFPFFSRFHFHFITFSFPFFRFLSKIWAASAEYGSPYYGNPIAWEPFSM